MIKINQAKKAKLDQEKINKEAKDYLASTDWYISRKQETGRDIPADILEKREIARSVIKN